MKPIEGIPGWRPPIPGAEVQPLELLARVLLSLTYSEMMMVAADLHSDIETHDPKPIDVADQLYRWAQRMMASEVKAR